VVTARLTMGSASAPTDVAAPIVTIAIVMPTMPVLYSFEVVGNQFWTSEEKRRGARQILNGQESTPARTSGPGAGPVGLKHGIDPNQ
jgi:hypothetical protein